MVDPEDKKAAKRRAAEEKKRAVAEKKALKLAKKAEKAESKEAKRRSKAGGSGDLGVVGAAFAARPSQRVQGEVKKRQAAALAAMPGMGCITEANSAAGADDLEDELDDLELDLGHTGDVDPTSDNQSPTSAGELPSTVDSSDPTGKLAEEAGAEDRGRNEANSDGGPSNLIGLDRPQHEAQAARRLSIPPPPSAPPEQPWTLAARWLTQLGVLPVVSPTGDQPTLLDFVSFLRDGLVLSDALNKLRPGLVSPHLAPTHSYKKDQNIDGVIAGCSELGLVNDQLFETEGLTDGSDFHAVVNTLAHLSQLPSAASHPEAQPFAPTAAEPWAASYAELEAELEKWDEKLDSDEGAEIYRLADTAHSQEGAYGLAGSGGFSPYGLPPPFDPYEMATGSLYEMANKNKLYEKAAKQQQQSPASQFPGQVYVVAKQVAASASAGADVAEPAAESVDGAGTETIAPRFHAIENLLQGTAVEKVQDSQGGTYDAQMAYDELMRQAEGTTLYSADSLSSSHRDHALKELAETEKNYLKVLTAINGVYRPALLASSLCSEADIAILLVNTTELLETSDGFFALLDQQMQSTTGRHVSGVFRKSLECFRAYAEYCCLMVAAMAKFEELNASPEGKSVFAKCHADSGQSFGLRTLLNVPMQRVLKYPLLLREIIKGTPDGHLDKDGLLEAQDALQALAMLVNETMRDYETVQSFAASLNGYNGPPLTDYYAFHKHRPAVIKDQELAYKGPGDKDKLAKRHVFLLPRALIVCQPSKGGTFVFKTLIEIAAGDGVETIFPTPKGLVMAKFKHVFSICTTTPAGKKDSHFFVAKAETTRNQWVKAINHNVTAIDETNTKPPPKIQKPKPKPMTLADTLWFAGAMDKVKAEAVLADKPDGTFLIRESSSKPGNYTVAVVSSGRVVQMGIKAVQHSSGVQYTLGATGKGFEKVEKLVTYYSANIIGGNLPTKMEFPYKLQ